jgi:hypothetical protein
MPQARSAAPSHAFLHLVPQLQSVGLIVSLTSAFPTKLVAQTSSTMSDSQLVSVQASGGNTQTKHYIYLRDLDVSRNFSDVYFQHRKRKLFHKHGF